MRVLVVTLWFPHAGNEGEGIFHLRDVELLSRHHEVTVLHLSANAPDSDEVRAGVRVLRRRFSLGSPAAYLRIRSLLSQLIVENELLHTMAFPALLPLGIHRISIPWVHTEHWSGLVWPPANAIARLATSVLRPLLRRPDRVVAVGTTLAEAIRNFVGRDVEVIGNQVRLATGAALPGPLAAVGPVRAVGVSSLRRNKGVMEAIDAIGVLRERGIDAELTWAGDGELGDELRVHAAARGLSEYVHLVGHQDPAALSDLLASGNVFLAPTAYETFGVAIAEALGHGLPVVATGEGGHRGFLPPLASRFVERNAEALAEGILALAADPARWPAEEIRRYAVALFDEDARLASYERVYTQVSA